MARILLLAFVLGVFSAAGARAQAAVNAGELERIADRFNFFTLYGEPDGPRRIIFADAREHVHVYRIEKGRAVVDWEATGLGSRASALLVRDADADGREEIIIATAGGRIVFYDAETFELLWENLDVPFGNIECLISENIDGDPQDEMIFVADSKLRIYDSLSKSKEWESAREFSAREMVLGNLDDDDQPEIIMNTGFIVDTRFYTVDFESEIRFGEKISLLDINGDGIPEVIGEMGDFTVRIFDIYAEREMW